MRLPFCLFCLFSLFSLRLRGRAVLYPFLPAGCCALLYPRCLPDECVFRAYLSVAFLPNACFALFSRLSFPRVPLFLVLSTFPSLLLRIVFISLLRPFLAFFSRPFRQKQRRRNIFLRRYLTRFLTNSVFPPSFAVFLYEFSACHPRKKPLSFFYFSALGRSGFSPTLAFFAIFCSALPSSIFCALPFALQQNLLFSFAAKTSFRFAVRFTVRSAARALRSAACSFLPLLSFYGTLFFARSQGRSRAPRW